jgi:hypothetical protein
MPDRDPSGFCGERCANYEGCSRIGPPPAELTAGEQRDECDHGKRTGSDRENTVPAPRA